MPKTKLPITYFQFPQKGGNVYAIDTSPDSFKEPKYVKLSNDTNVVIALSMAKQRFPKIQELKPGLEEQVTPDFTARLVISAESGFWTRFEGDWEPLLEYLEAAAALGISFSVHLTDEEYERLCTKRGWASLRKHVSKRVHLPMTLFEDTYEGVGGPALKILPAGKLR